VAALSRREQINGTLRRFRKLGTWEVDMGRIHRSRWLVGALTFTLTLAPVLSCLANSAGASATVRTTNLPENLGFTGLTATGGSVSLTGSIQTGAGIEGDCDLAPLTTDPLGVGETTLRTCADPALWGEPVVEFETVLPRTFNVALHAARRVDGAVRLGPVLATYQSDSGSHPVAAYGAGSLWIYEEQGPGGPTVFRVSLATGALQATVRAPGLTRPFLIADDDGAWLIPAGSWGAVTDAAVYHLAVGSDTIVPVLTLPGYAQLGYAAWAVATGHSVYADLCIRPIGPSTCTLYGLSGLSAREVFQRTSPVGPFGDDCALAGPSGVYVLYEVSVVSKSSPGLYNWPVERVNTQTGATSTIATVTLPEFWDGPDGTSQPDAVIDGKALFILATQGDGAPTFVEEAQW
jgi:hypothetical protein